MCGVSFRHEMEEPACGAQEIYASIEHLKKHCKCWDECGIVEVEVTLIKYVSPENFDIENINKKK